LGVEHIEPKRGKENESFRGHAVLLLLASLL
jgi:hypothetical protein